MSSKYFLFDNRDVLELHQEQGWLRWDSREGVVPLSADDSGVVPLTANDTRLVPLSRGEAIDRMK